MAKRWKILARHNRWVVGAKITESTDLESEGRVHRFTATIRGYGNWKIYQGETPADIGNQVQAAVMAIRDRIDEEDESVFKESNDFDWIGRGVDNAKSRDTIE